MLYDKELQTPGSLLKDMNELGVTRGTNLMVHSSLGSIGWVLGGASTVVKTLLEAIDGGTLAMPAATPNCADPSLWEGPKVPESKKSQIREHLPLFDVLTTPTSMGAIAECFRTWPDTERSDHPLSSVCANGPLASEVTGQHALEFSEADGTPFQKQYDLDFDILLIGVGFNRCTALHFAESRVKNRRTTTNRFPIIKSGRKEWIEVRDMANDNSTYFPAAGEGFVGTGKVTQGKIGEAHCYLFNMGELVHFAMNYFDRHL